MAELSKEAKVQLVQELLKRVGDKVIAYINEDKMPADWDGLELRRLVADKFEQETTTLPLDRHKDYVNMVRVCNL